MRYIARIVRLWCLYASLELIWMTRDPGYFLLCFISDGILAIGGVTSAFLLAERFQGIGAWSKAEVLFMLGYGLIVCGLTSTFLGYNVLHISRRLGRGQLDHTLIQPQPLWLSLMTEGFSPISGASTLLPGLGLTVWAVRSMALSATLSWTAALISNLLASMAVLAAFSFLWGSLAFWAPRAAEEISSSAVDIMSGLRSFPLDGGSSVLVGGLLTVLPVGFTAWYPARHLVGLDTSAWGALATPAVAVAMVVLAAFVFRKGLREYGRTGSQRYLTLGHRR